jgi:hypothetical protein
LAEFLYTREEMSGGNIDKLMNILAAMYPDRDPPAADHRELYSIIDRIEKGVVSWTSFDVSYSGPPVEEGEYVAPWKEAKYEVWFRDPLAILERQLANPEFRHHIDYAPKRMFKNRKRQYVDLMSGTWAWDQAVCRVQHLLPSKLIT